MKILIESVETGSAHTRHFDEELRRPTVDPPGPGRPGRITERVRDADLSRTSIAPHRQSASSGILRHPFAPTPHRTPASHAGPGLLDPAERAIRTRRSAQTIPAEPPGSSGPFAAHGLIPATIGSRLMIT